jgi:thymidylate synthase
MLRFSLKDGQIPLITTKKMAWKTCFHELFWFISGKTDNRVLQEKGVHIWDANASREFLDERGLEHYQEGDLGPIYGFQWRHWNAKYDGCDENYMENENRGIDQLYQIIRDLKNEHTRQSRRLVISAWNVGQLHEMALPPCHILMQFNVREGKYLSCSMYQRSGDVGLGVPFNIASYSLLTHILAHHCGLIAEDFVYFLGNAHIYEEHTDALKIQIKRPPKTFPKISIVKRHENIEDYGLEDIEWITPYEYHEPIKMTMNA